MSLIEIVAVPNGSGKSTFAESFLVRGKRSMTYINPDIIAAGFGKLNQEERLFKLENSYSRSTQKILKKESFAFESTLLGKTWHADLLRAKELGFKINIYFIFLTNMIKNIERIKKRVLMGGHNIPNETIKRRHPRCFENFWNLYRQICDEWTIFNNSKKIPILIMDSVKFSKLSPNQQAQFENKFLRYTYAKN